MTTTSTRRSPTVSVILSLMLPATTIGSATIAVIRMVRTADRVGPEHGSTLLLPEPAMLVFLCAVGVAIYMGRYWQQTRACRIASRVSHR